MKLSPSNNLRESKAKINEPPSRKLSRFTGLFRKRKEKKERKKAHHHRRREMHRCITVHTAAASKWVTGCAHRAQNRSPMGVFFGSHMATRVFVKCILGRALESSVIASSMLRRRPRAHDGKTAYDARHRVSWRVDRWMRFAL